VRPLHAPAKVNLTLEILGRRADGYHGLRSVAVPIGIYDEIWIEETAGALAFSCDNDQIDPENNLVVKALRALALAPLDFTIFLKKRIPIGAGLGGGSSDAAAVLLAAMNGELGRAGRRDYLTIAQELGSDVAFFLSQTAAIMEGAGERVTPLGAIPTWGCTVVKPPSAIATATAYSELSVRRESRPRASSATIQLGEALQRGDLRRVQALAQNDFESWAASKYADVQTALNALHEWNGFSQLSGSGSAVYTIYEEMPTAPLRLPSGFQRFDTTFVSTPVWRTPNA